MNFTANFFNGYAGFLFLNGSHSQGFHKTFRHVCKNSELIKLLLTLNFQG